MALCASKVWDKPNGPIVSEQRDCRPREQVLPFGPGPWQGMDHRLGIMGQNTIEASQSWKPILQASTQHLPTHQMPLRQNWLKLYFWVLISCWCLSTSGWVKQGVTERLMNIFGMQSFHGQWFHIWRCDSVSAGAVIAPLDKSRTKTRHEIILKGSKGRSFKTTSWLTWHGFLSGEGKKGQTKSTSTTQNETPRKFKWKGKGGSRADQKHINNTDFETPRNVKWKGKSTHFHPLLQWLPVCYNVGAILF